MRFETASETFLEKLIDLRLVRHVQDKYEVAHDFLARIIVDQLVDYEEHEYKRLRELLSSKAFAFHTTGGLLSTEEALMLYKSRARFIPNTSELELIFNTWCTSQIPGLFWLKDAQREQILSWSTNLARIEDSRYTDSRFAIAAIKTHFKIRLLREEYAGLTKVFQLAQEAALILRRTGDAVPSEVLLRGFQNRRTEVRDACYEIIAHRIERGDLELLEILRRSSSRNLQTVYERLILDGIDVRFGHADHRSRSVAEFISLRSVCHAPSSVEVARSFRSLRLSKPRRRALVFGRALCELRLGNIDRLVRRILTSNLDTSEILLSACSQVGGHELFEKMLNLYRTLNARELPDYRPAATYKKAAALATAIRKASTTNQVVSLRQLVSEIRLTPSSRDIVLALLAIGSPEDLEYVLQKISGTEHSIRYENHLEICSNMIQRLSTFSSPIPSYLTDVSLKRDFWDYVPSEERRPHDKQNLLSLRNYDNRALYIRISACGIIGLAQSNDKDALLRMTQHPYRAIARIAAARAANLFGDAALQYLSADIPDAMRAGRAETVADALRAAEIGIYLLRDTLSASEHP